MLALLFRLSALRSDRSLGGKTSFTSQLAKPPDTSFSIYAQRMRLGAVHKKRAVRVAFALLSRCFRVAWHPCGPGGWLRPRLLEATGHGCRRRCTMLHI